MTVRGWNTRDAAQALLASYRHDYSHPGTPCTECHCEDCMATMKRPCCTLARLLMAAKRIVDAPRGVPGRGRAK